MTEVSDEKYQAAYELVADACHGDMGPGGDALDALIAAGWRPPGADVPDAGVMDAFGWTAAGGHRVHWKDGTVTQISDREHALIAAAYELGIHHANLTERT